MCHYISAVLPKEADVVGLDVIARRYHRQFEILANPSFDSQLRPGERHFLTTLGHCDCGTVLGSRARAGSEESRGHTAELRQLRAKGWSEAKISRWLAQKQQVGARDERVRSTREIPSTDEWRAFIQAILESRLTPYVGILLHLYSGPLSGRVQLSARQVVTVAELTGDVLAEMEEDVIYDFRPDHRELGR